MKETFLSRLIALGLLIAAVGLRIGSTRQSSLVEEHNRRICDAAAVIPRRIGSWVGSDVPLPVQSVATLKPNVTISRSFVNIESGVTAGFLLVHCADAHAMAGHFPLRCYPAEDWEVASATARDWTIDGLRMTGTEYRFTKDAIKAGGLPKAMIVANCLLRPGGLILRDMDAFSRSMIGAGSEMTGAGQIQVYFDASLPLADREAAIAALVSGHRAVVDAILAPVGPVGDSNKDSMTVERAR